MLVYRVEHVKLKEGPYTISGEYKCRKLLNSHERKVWSSHPPFSLDIYGVNHTDQISEEKDINGFICGFHDIESLKEWFNEHFKELKEKGFVVRVFSVSHKNVRFGTKQLIFKRPRLKKQLVKEFKGFRYLKDISCH